jgi:hypothetical protein
LDRSSLTVDLKVSLELGEELGLTNHFSDFLRVEELAFLPTK